MFAIGNVVGDPEPVPAVTALGFNGIGTRLVAGCADGVVYMLGVPACGTVARNGGGWSDRTEVRSGRFGGSCRYRRRHVAVPGRRVGRGGPPRAAPGRRCVDVAVAPDGNQVAALDDHGLLTLAVTRGQEQVRFAVFRPGTEAFVEVQRRRYTLAVAGYGCTVFEMPAGTPLDNAAAGHQFGCRGLRSDGSRARRCGLAPHDAGV